MSTTQSRLCCNPKCSNIDGLEKQKNSVPVRCNCCRKAIYCSELCQSVHWTVHKRACKSPTESSTTTEGPFVLLLSLGKHDILAGTNEHFLSALRSTVRVIQSLDTREALQYLTDTNLKGVVVADEGISESENSEVLSCLMGWVDAGGTAVFGCLFPAFISFKKFNPFFKKWGLPWTIGAYTRSSVVLNPWIRQSSRHSANLVASYTMKALHLNGVKAEDILYAPTKEEEEEEEEEDEYEYEYEYSSVQPRMFPPLTVSLSDGVPVVAHTQIGRGFLGYVGDVSGNEGSTSAILAMLASVKRNTK